MGGRLEHQSLNVPVWGQRPSSFLSKIWPKMIKNDEGYCHQTLSPKCINFDLFVGARAFLYCSQILKDAPRITLLLFSAFMLCFMFDSMVFPVCYILETLVILRSLKRSNNFFIKNIGNDVVEFHKNCFEVVIVVSFSGANNSLNYCSYRINFF